MVKAWIGQTNFYEVVKRKEAERRAETSQPDPNQQPSFGELVKTQVHAFLAHFMTPTPTPTSVRRVCLAVGAEEARSCCSSGRAGYIAWRPTGRATRGSTWRAAEVPTVARPGDRRVPRVGRSAPSCCHVQGIHQRNTELSHVLSLLSRLFRSPSESPTPRPQAPGANPVLRAAPVRHRQYHRHTGSRGSRSPTGTATAPVRAVVARARGAGPALVDPL